MAQALLLAPLQTALVAVQDAHEKAREFVQNAKAASTVRAYRSRLARLRNLVLNVRVDVAAG